MSSDRYETAMKQDAADARYAGITGTPSFILGKTTDNVVDGEVILGAQPFLYLDERIAKLLQDSNVRLTK